MVPLESLSFFSLLGCGEGMKRGSPPSKGSCRPLFDRTTTVGVYSSAHRTQNSGVAFAPMSAPPHALALLVSDDVECVLPICYTARSIVFCSSLVAPPLRTICVRSTDAWVHLRSL